MVSFDRKHILSLNVLFAGLQQSLSAQKREYDDLTAKYELLEEEHVAMKQRMVREKEVIET